MQKPKQVATSFADCGHFGDNGKVVYDKGNVISLLLGEIPCVTYDPKACDVCGSMCIKFVH